MHRITRIEAIDQNNFTQAFISFYYFNENSRIVELEFDSFVSPMNIDFLIDIYGAPLVPNDFFLGQKTEKSELVFK